MKCRREVVFVALIFNFCKIRSALATNTDTNLITLIFDVQNFYKSSGVFIIYEQRHGHGDFMSHQMLLVKSILQLSREHIMSQAITYDHLHLVTHHPSIDDNSNQRYSSRAMEPLFAVFVHDTESVKHFQRVTRSMDVSAYSWFFFIYNEAGIDCANPSGNPFNVRMDTRIIVKCENSMSLKKYYSIFENVTEVAELAIWTPGTRLIVKKDDNLLQVKKSMRGITLKLARKRETSRAYNTNLGEFLRSLVGELENITHFNTYIAVEDDFFGYYNQTSREWIGLMKIMYEKRADIVMMLLSMSKSRMQGVDFTIPLMRARDRLYAKLPDTPTIHWSAYFRVFDKYTWITLGLVILALSAMIGLIKNELRKPYINVNTCLGNFINVWGVYTQQGLSEPPSNTSSQILYFWILISSLIINAIYSATITSYIAVLTTYLPFSTYEEFLNTKDYKVIIIRGTRDEDLIHSNDTLLAPLKDRLKPTEDLPWHPYEGLKQACDGDVAVYMDEASYDGVSQNIPCAIGWLNLPREEFMSLALSKDSPYKETLNYYILRLMNHGLLSRLKQIYFFKVTEFAETKPNVVSLLEVMPLLSIWLVGVVVSSSIFCLEIILYNCQRFAMQRRRLMKRKNKQIIAWQ